MTQELMKAATEIQEDLVEWRRALHRMPEIGMDLPRTVSYVGGELEKIGIPYVMTAGGSCITALIGSHKGNCILLRSDMDGLPIREETNLPYASENGQMHACGHDLHTAILLGAAKLLHEREDSLQGTVKLLFQAGEETFSGAKLAIEDGLLESPAVDAAFACHVSPAVPVGAFLYGEEAMSSVYGFRIEISGKGGHGSQPDKCIDPISVGVQIHLALQELMSRECPPTTHAALTIGQFQAGDASNVIPQRAILSGTLRTFDAKVRDFLVGRIGEIVPAVAAAYRASATVTALCDVPAVHCDRTLTNFMVKELGKLDSTLKFLPLFHAMGSEDFAFISEKVPSSYLCLGAAPCDPSKAVWPHNPTATFSEDCLSIGAAAYTQAAIRWLAQNA